MARNILFIEHSDGFGGSCAALAGLIGHLDPQRYKPYAVVSHPLHREQLAPYIPMERILLDRAKTLRPQAGIGRCLNRTLGRFGRFGHKLASMGIAGINVLVPVPRFARRVRRRFSDIIFDVVWLNNGIGNNFGAGALLARRWKVPLVCKVQGFEYVSPSTKWLARNIDYFIPNSQAVSERLVKLGIPLDCITTTYEPIDVDEFDSSRIIQVGEFKRRNGASNPLAFGIIGQLLEWKGQHVFLEAAKRVCDAFPGCVAVIVGSEPDRSGQRMRYLKEYAARLGISDRVIFTGHRDDIPQVISELDVVVHGSILPEPLGMVILEAMAMKKPVIASRAGGPLEIVDEGVNGFLCEPGNAALMADLILSLLRDSDLRLRMGGNGRKKVVEHFSAEKHARDTQALLDKVIESKSHRHDG